MAMVTSQLKVGSAPSKEALARVKAAAKYPVTFDEDCPELTDRELREFRPVNPALHANPAYFKPKKKQITLKIDADVLEAYRETGKGYQTRMNEALRNSAIAAGLLQGAI
ncbi:BrnA antitoxin family protein [Selenomonas sp.]|uniref:BrnA antitoxin family protein n=1 Tax=Selenomonas sp. TaxID=2053611 RepID=UPI0025EDDA56|nr:BrnA antitoxin family protein [Selenomonas sp.]MCI6086060.1 BrnA antitoxin family protein [Selenomonas sp.]MCI6283142.1 BrnA antitoxin family protein [Selenomonas sp.]